MDGLPPASTEPIRLRLSDLDSLPAADRVEACRSFIERTAALLAAVRQETSSAGDPRGLVTATVGGNGAVEEVRLELPAARCGAAELEAAVLAAVSAAQAAHRARTIGLLSSIQVRHGDGSDERADEQG